LRLRVALTLAGAAAITLGSFLVWLRPLHFNGFQLSHRIFYRFYFTGHAHVPKLERSSRFLSSTGFVMLLLSVLTFLGLALRRGWLTSLAGALALISVAAYLLTVTGARIQRPLGLGSALGPGAVVVLVGGTLAFVGGFFGTLPPKIRTRTIPPVERAGAPRAEASREASAPGPESKTPQADEWWSRTRRPRES
jgi:hypothetical protein